MFDDVAKDHFVSNVAGHLGNVKSAEVKARQRASRSLFPLSKVENLLRNTICDTLVSVFAAVDQTIADRIAKAINHAPVQPLKAKPAAEAVRFRYNAASS